MVDVAADQIRTAEAAGLDGEAFGFEPFLKQRDLGGAAGAVHAFDYDQAALDFAGVEADQRLAVEMLGGFFFGGSEGRRLGGVAVRTSFGGGRGGLRRSAGDGSGSRIGGVAVLTMRGVRGLVLVPFLSLCLFLVLVLGHAHSAFAA